MTSVGFLCATSVLLNAFLLPLIGFVYPHPYLPTKTAFETRVSTIMASSWSAYGAKINDNNIMIPNLLGLFLSLALLFLRYSKVQFN